MSPAQRLPVEILVYVFSFCSYIDLLSISSACRVWRVIVDSDPYLRVRMFKSLGDNIESLTNFMNTNSKTLPYTKIQIHPAMMRVSFRLGEELATAGFSYQDPTTHVKHTRPLHEFAISTDFATIPTVKSMNIEVKRPLCICCRPAILSFTVNVQNATGIRVLDVFSAMAEEARMQCDLVHLASRGAFSQRLQPGQKKSTTVKADTLGRHREYAGLVETITNQGTITFKSHTAA